jgi:hypothetical protein
MVSTCGEGHDLHPAADVVPRTCSGGGGAIMPDIPAQPLAPNYMTQSQGRIVMIEGGGWVPLEYGFPDTKFVFSEPIDVFASLTQLPSVRGRLLRLSSAGFRELE